MHTFKVKRMSYKQRHDEKYAQKNDRQQRRNRLTKVIFDMFHKKSI